VPALFKSSLLRTAHNTNTVGLHTPCSSPRKEENAEAWVDMAEGELTGQTGQTKDSRGAKHTDLPLDTQGRALVQHCMLTTIACTPIVSGEEGRGEEKGERSTGRRLSPEADLPPLDPQAMGQWEAESAFQHSGHGKPADGIATHKAGGRRLSPDGPPPPGHSMAWDEGSDWEVHTIFSSSTTTTTEDGCSGNGGERRRRGRRRLCPESGSEPEDWRCWDAEASFNSTHNTNNHTHPTHYTSPRNNPSGPSCTSPVGGETDGECSSGFSSPSRAAFAPPSPAPASSLSHEDEDEDGLCDWAEAMGTQVRQAQQDGGLDLCLSPSPSSSSSSSSLGPASSQGLVYLVAFRSPRPVSPPSWHPCFRPVVAVGRVAQRAYPMQALQRWLHYTFYCRLFKLWHTQQPALVQPPPDPPGTFTLGMGRRRTGGESRGRGCVVEGHGGVRDVLSAFTSHGKAYDHYRFLNMERDDAKTGTWGIYRDIYIYIYIYISDGACEIVEGSRAWTGQRLIMGGSCRVVLADKGLPLTLTRYPRVFTEVSPHPHFPSFSLTALHPNPLPCPYDSTLVVSPARRPLCPRAPPLVNPRPDPAVRLRLCTSSLGLACGCDPSDALHTPAAGLPAPDPGLSAPRPPPSQSEEAPWGPYPRGLGDYRGGGRVCGQAATDPRGRQGR
jgi:hypothetical protein